MVCLLLQLLFFTGRTLLTGIQSKSQEKKLEWNNVRVGNVEAGQVVGSVTEEVKQSVARCGHHLGDCLVTSALRYHQPTVIDAVKHKAVVKASNKTYKITIYILV